MADVKVLPIERGSLIVLIDCDLGESGEGSIMGEFIDGLREKCGHDEFLILNVDGGARVEVFGTPEEAVARVKTALVIAGALKPDDAEATADG